MNHILPYIKNYKRQPKHIKDRVKKLVDQLSKTRELEPEEYLFILDHITIDDTAHLFKRAFEAKLPHYQNRVYVRGLIEISNYCKRGCKYCGINRNNTQAHRYRLTAEQIFNCVENGYNLGYRTFVLQGGEDPYFTDDIMTDIIRSIKQNYPDTRITLSLGERSKESYQALYQAGADRYLVRHESASKRLYEHLHPNDSVFEDRIQALWDLKEVGYQTGCGFMVGSPTQTNEDLVNDLVFLKELNPHMVGIGPYLCHEETELSGNDSGTLMETYIMVALTRLIVPEAMLPATTALSILDKLGKENALNVGANVMMPNISPNENKQLYEIYKNKVPRLIGYEQDRDDTEKRINAFQHIVDFGVGDCVSVERMMTSD